MGSGLYTAFGCVHNTGPTLTNFTTIYTSEVDVTIKWTLQFNGVRPLQNMTLTLRNGTEVTATSEIIVDDPVSDGNRFNYSFTGLEQGMRYSLEINAYNSLHKTSMFYTIDIDISKSTYYSSSVLRACA